METKKQAGFGSSIGFILSAAGSAVGLGNIWRFPYLAAKDGGGLFLLVYVALVLTFGFTLLTTDVAIGRKTGKSPIQAFETIGKKWKFIGVLAFLVPGIIMAYYSVIGGWIVKYLTVYLTRQTHAAADAGYFGAFITSYAAPILFMLVYLAAVTFVVYRGVEKGIEKFSKLVMPALIIMILGIGLFSLTLEYTDENGVVRTGLQGLKVYVIPNFEGVTFSKFLGIVVDAMNQMFYSLSIAMGIMITYGSYVKKEMNLGGAISKIEIFDTLVAFLAGLMIVPTVFVFFGMDGLSTAGASLMFKSLPKTFDAMGTFGPVIGAVFFVMVLFAALTSSVSIMETLVGNCMEFFKKSRKQVALTLFGVYTVGAIIVCLGYNIWYFDLMLPNSTQPGQLLDLLDYISNSLMMPIVAFFTSVVIGWVVKPQWIIEEMESSGHKFGRKKLYAVMIRYIIPVAMVVIFAKAFIK